MKGIFGLSANKSAAFAYIGFFVTGILVLIFADKSDKKLRFHGLQSTIVLGSLLLFRMLVGWIVGWIPFVGGIIGGVLTAVVVICWIGLVAFALTGVTFRVPILGDACWTYISKEE